MFTNKILSFLVFLHFLFMMSVATISTNSQNYLQDSLYSLDYKLAYYYFSFIGMSNFVISKESINLGRQIQFIMMGQTPKHKNINFLKSDRPVTKKVFTQIIFEDDCLIHNIKIKGSSFKDPNADLHHELIAEKKIMTKSLQERRKKFVNDKSEKKKISNWANRTASVLKQKNKKQENSVKLMRSITSQSIKIMNRSLYQDRTKTQSSNKEEHGRSKSIENGETLIDPYPRLTYKQKNLNQQVYCNFKGILDQFNKAKHIIQRKIMKNDQKKEIKFKHSYKKPNYYQYQQFYRQNYQAKQLQEAITLFKKCDYKESIDVKNEEHSQRYSINNQLSSRYTSHGYRKISKVLVTSNDFKLSCCESKEEKSKRDEMPSYLLSKNRTSRKRDANKKVLCINQTLNEEKRKLHYSFDSCEIEPWRSHDQNEIGF